MSNLIKKIILLFFLITIFLTICISTFKESFKSVSSIESSRIITYEKNFSIYIDNMRGTYSHIDNAYYFSHNDSDVHINSINIKSNKNYKYKIIDKKIKKYENGQILIYNDKEYQIINIKFTNIPIISIYDNNHIDLSIENVNKKKIKNDSLIFISSNIDKDINGKGYVFSLEYHERGNTTKKFPKKSYKLNIDSDKYILGIPYGENYVLDPLYMDSSKVRNKLTSDLWNLSNNNQIYDNDLYTQFVEVYINDNYMGLYLLKNSVSKRCFSIDKSGYLLKAYNKFKPNDYSVNEEHILNFVFKYSNDKNKTYKNFADKIQYVYNNNQNYESMNKTFYMDNYLNYILMVIFTFGIDNIDKNYYLSLNGSSDKLLITPWDLDLTFGNSWGKNEFNGEIFNPGSYNDTKILNRIIKNIDEPTLELLKKRYQELRKDVYNIETIDKFLNQYKNELNKDIIKRDTDRWYFYDLNEKTEQISNWSKSRFYFLDQYFDKL